MLHWTTSRISSHFSMCEWRGRKRVCTFCYCCHWWRCCRMLRMPIHFQIFIERERREKNRSFWACASCRAIHSMRQHNVRGIFCSAICDRNMHGEASVACGDAIGCVFVSIQILSHSIASHTTEMRKCVTQMEFCCSLKFGSTLCVCVRVSLDLWILFASVETNGWRQAAAVAAPPCTATWMCSLSLHTTKTLDMLKGISVLIPFKCSTWFRNHHSMERRKS